MKNLNGVWKNLDVVRGELAGLKEGLASALEQYSAAKGWEKPHKAMGIVSDAVPLLRRTVAYYLVWGTLGWLGLAAYLIVRGM